MRRQVPISPRVCHQGKVAVISDPGRRLVGASNPLKLPVPRRKEPARLICLRAPMVHPKWHRHERKGIPLRKSMVRIGPLTNVYVLQETGIFAHQGESIPDISSKYEIKSRSSQSRQSDRSAFDSPGPLRPSACSDQSEPRWPQPLPKPKYGRSFRPLSDRCSTH